MSIEQTRAGRRGLAARRRRLSVVGVIGELLITAGVLVLLFLGWQLWLDNLVVGNEQNAEAQQQSIEWNKGGSSAPAPV
ncbi:MAG: class E sortase, partial [Rhodoglobus sp.]